MKLRNIIPLWILVLFFTAFHANIYCQYDLVKKMEEKEAENIRRAKIKSMTQYILTSDMGKTPLKGEKTLRNDFDSTGHCIHWVRFLAGGKKIEEKNTYLLDEKEKQKELSSHGMNGNLDSRLLSKFNDKGQEMETIKILPDGSKAFRWVHKYDAKGRETESVTFKGIDTSQLRKVYKYNDKDHTIETNFLRGETVTYRIVKKYDENGNETSEKQFSADGALIRTEENIFDHSGNKVSGRVLNAEGKLISRYDYKYDDFGNLLEEISFDVNSNSSVIAKYEYEFNY